MHGQVADAAPSSGDLSPPVLVDDQRLTRGEFVLFAVDDDTRRAFGDEKQDVTLSVDVLGRTAAGAPDEQRCIQILGRVAPHGAAGYRFGMVETTIKLCPRLSLDQRKQLPLLEAHMRLKPLAHLTHPLHVGRAGEGGRERV